MKTKKLIFGCTIHTKKRKFMTRTQTPMKIAQAIYEYNKFKNIVISHISYKKINLTIFGTIISVLQQNQGYYLKDFLHACFNYNFKLISIYFQNIDFFVFSFRRIKK